VLRLHRASRAVPCTETCGDDLTRANVMKQRASIRSSLELGGVLPGINVQHFGQRLCALLSLQLMKCKGEACGAVRRTSISGDVGVNARPLDEFTTKKAASPLPFVAGACCLW